MLKLLLLAVLAFALTVPPSVVGWSLWPGARYWVKIENALKDALGVHCECRGYKPIGPLQIPPGGQFNWTFKTKVSQKALYTCTLTWPNHGSRSFVAFEDDQGFVDSLCGGRHCSWKAAEDAIYLYCIYKHKYVKMQEWDRPSKLVLFR